MNDADEFQIFDYMDNLRLPTFEFLTSIHCVYIPKDKYDADLNKCLKTEYITKKQLLLDMPRSDIYVEGEKQENEINNIPRQLFKYCTQAVMGIPVELLSKTGIVAEPLKTKRMIVDVWNNTAYIYKNLRIYTDENTWIHVTVEILVDNTECILIKFIV